MCCSVLISLSLWAAHVLATTFVAAQLVATTRTAASCARRFFLLSRPTITTGTFTVTLSAALLSDLRHQPPPNHVIPTTCFVTSAIAVAAANTATTTAANIFGLAPQHQLAAVRISWPRQLSKLSPLVLLAGAVRYSMQPNNPLVNLSKAISVCVDTPCVAWINRATAG